jgi:hypothetical protein
MAEMIRACRREDIPAVVDIFARVLLKQKRLPGADLSNYFEDLVFGGAPPTAEARSRVFVDKAGEVRGFIGIWPRRMVLQGRTIEAAAAGSLMVDRPEENPIAGARLLRSFLTGPQDLSFSETANDVSQRMWEKAGGERLPATSLDWLGARVEAVDIVRHCARFLEDFMVPKFVEFRPSLPKTDSGKISRRLVAETQAGKHHDATH